MTKIKCPLCDFETIDRDNITIHLENTHGLTSYRLVSKIHETIEYLQSRIKGNHFEDCDDGHDFETHQNIEFALEELKSLLEGEKQ